MLLEDTKGSRWKWKRKRGGMGGSRKGYRGSVIARRRLRFRDRANREWFSPELFHSSQFPDQRRIRSGLGRRTWSSIRVVLFFPSSHRRLYTNNRYERVHRCRLLFFPPSDHFYPLLTVVGGCRPRLLSAGNGTDKNTIDGRPGIFSLSLCESFSSLLSLRFFSSLSLFLFCRWGLLSPSLALSLCPAERLVPSIHAWDQYAPMALTFRVGGVLGLGGRILAKGKGRTS